MKTIEQIEHFLDEVTDPEIPVLTIRDLGLVRDIRIKSDTAIEVDISPTYSACPALDTIVLNIKYALFAMGFVTVKVKDILSPAWTTDWMTEEGKEKLLRYGIAPPQYMRREMGTHHMHLVPCPRCHSVQTELISQFGSTACKALYKCTDCLEPFDYFKCP